MVALRLVRILECQIKAVTRMAIAIPHIRINLFFMSDLDNNERTDGSSGLMPEFINLRRYNRTREHQSHQALCQLKRLCVPKRQRARKSFFWGVA
jgi:hypothetical protein